MPYYIPSLPKHVTVTLDSNACFWSTLIVAQAEEIRLYQESFPFIQG